MSTLKADTTKAGNDIRRDLSCMDSADTFYHLGLSLYGLTTEGWKTYPTGQDCSYYRMWTNDTTMQVLTYCEGDIITVTCKHEDDYKAELFLTDQWRDNDV